MATASRAARATGPREDLYTWEGKDKTGKVVRGEIRATGDAMVQAMLRRQGIQVIKIRKQKMARGGRISEKDIALFTRQLATMMKSGVPLLQAFDIAMKGSGNAALVRLLNDIRTDVETGSNLSQAFAKHPAHFDRLFCNLVAAGEQAGILDGLLDRIATYKEKILAIKSKIKSALFYPAAVVVVAGLVISVMMLFVIPEFKSVFSSFGAELPVPTLMVIAISDAFVAYWYLIFGALIAALVAIAWSYKRSTAMQIAVDRLVLRIPVIGAIIRKATVARWTRTLSTMFAAGVPLVESLDSVGGASGNHVYKVATKQIQSEVSTGTSLTVAMQNANVFPNMVMQMAAIGEESGSLDSMLSKSADIFEREVDEAVASLSSLLEPLIMVFLGVLLGFAVKVPIWPWNWPIAALTSGTRAARHRSLTGPRSRNSCGVEPIGVLPLAKDVLKTLGDLAAAAARFVRRAQADRQSREETGRPFLIGGLSPEWREVERRIELASPTRAPILLRGESGTGKDLVARAIHGASRRVDRPFVAVNCAAIPETLLESILFGHVRGAFTGATTEKIGEFQKADGGTLFLDEVGELPRTLQPKLLRALEERSIRPIGATAEVAVDVRVLAATHRDLAADVEAGRFRADLYYRLNALRLALPPLRDRRDDIAELARHFARTIAAHDDSPPRELTADALDRLRQLPWPGNVRELRNCIEHAVAMATGPRLDVADLPPLPAMRHGDAAVSEWPTLEELEHGYLDRVLAHVGGNRSAAARMLGIDRRTLMRKLAARRGEAAPADE